MKDGNLPKHFSYVVGEKIRGIKDLKDAETTKYDKFGDKMKTLVNRIQRHKWTGQTPVGPLGAWFTVKVCN